MSRVVSKRGAELLCDPLLNKGSAFSPDERAAFGLNGLLPPQVSSLDEQAERAIEQVAAAETPLGRYAALAALYDRNQTLFYRVLCEHLETLMPIVYTPTVGLATQRFSHIYQRGRGLWITPDCAGNVEAMMQEAAGGEALQLIVVTDNEAILGIGDQGVGGMAISVGKIALYVAGAGIRPSATLPVSLDVGTDNQSLLDDPLYLGYRQPRLRGAAYDALVEEFVTAVRKLFPDALVQWEDFKKDNALRLMEQYRDRVLSFNDDIQGTGAVALAGILSALRVTGGTLPEQRVLIYGAGAAGLGIARQIKAALIGAGLSDEAARAQLLVLDSRGPIADDRPGLDAYKVELAWPAERAADLQGELSQVVDRFKPHVLVGASGQTGAFDEAVVRAMAAHTARPVILPFSNPTDRSEAVPEDIIRWTDGAALVATGSPFEPVPWQDREIRIGQGNNVFIFPGLGLGAIGCGAAQVTDEMITAAAHALARCVNEDELSSGLLFPEVSRLRSVSMAVAAAVVRTAGGSNTEFQPWQPEYEAYRAR